MWEGIGREEGNGGCLSLRFALLKVMERVMGVDGMSRHDEQTKRPNTVMAKTFHQV